MKILTISTDMYTHQISKYFSEINVNNIENNKDSITYRLTYQQFDVPKFSEILQNIILIKNPILKNSEKTFSVIKKILFSENSTYIENDLETYFLNNDALYVDAYVNFALREYSEKIDYILYNVVKRDLKRKKDEL